MKKIDFKITDAMVFPNHDYKKPEKYQYRVTVKAIVENDNGDIALITNPVHGLFLLPGGGAESDDLVAEIKRECDEEINWEVDNIEDVASVEEFRNRDGKHYTTYCFSAKAVRELPEDTRTSEEKENGLEVVWLSKESALDKLRYQKEILEKGDIVFYNTGFNVLRDYIFLTEYLS